MANEYYINICILEEKPIKIHDIYLSLKKAGWSIYNENDEIRCNPPAYDIEEYNKRFDKEIKTEEDFIDLIKIRDLLKKSVEFDLHNGKQEVSFIKHSETELSFNILNDRKILSLLDVDEKNNVMIDYDWYYKTVILPLNRDFTIASYSLNFEIS